MLPPCPLQAWMEIWPTPTPPLPFVKQCSPPHQVKDSSWAALSRWSPSSWHRHCLGLGMRPDHRQGVQGAAVEALEVREPPFLCMSFGKRISPFSWTSGGRMRDPEGPGHFLTPCETGGRGQGTGTKRTHSSHQHQEGGAFDSQSTSSFCVSSLKYNSC